MLTLISLNGDILCNKEDIAKEILDFYTNLVGTASMDLKGINIPCVVSGKILSRESGLDLVKPVSKREIWEALDGIGNTKAPGLDGFNDFFFKESWQIVKIDVFEAIQEFFRTGRMHKALNCSLITLIPKSGEAKTIKD
ncbi:uncharacterized protein LOC131598332 [Vicia villosa]|uniref:uncharacterized protein LOC131598332 n=1 Tax=Vicia villosa TaxID=3911 RepID=UPI00273A9DBE|nr:uncharacterized protein LOC131598332 [Vicia villosa]